MPRGDEPTWRRWVLELPGDPQTGWVVPGAVGEGVIICFHSAFVSASLTCNRAIGTIRGD